jgi:hypothetical protein
MPDSTPFSMGMEAIRYTIDTTIHPDNSLEACATIEFRVAAVRYQCTGPGMVREADFDLASARGDNLA